MLHSVAKHLAVTVVAFLFFWVLGQSGLPLYALVLIGIVVGILARRFLSWSDQ